jgi:methionyl-tRNA formyltransferase
VNILFLTNNPITTPLVEWLEQHERVTVYHQKLSVEQIQELMPDFIISYNYRFIIKENILKLVNRRIINLHISYLPWNRGAYPNVWSILDGTPKGVTIHYIDEQIDTGDIIVQEKCEFDLEKETLRSSYEKLHQQIQNLFIMNWNLIKQNKIECRKQTGQGSLHYIKDFKELDNLFGGIDWNMNLKQFKNIYIQIKSQTEND